MFALRQNLNTQTLNTLIGIAAAGLCFLATAAFQVPQLNRLQQPAQTQSIEQLKQSLEIESLRLNLLETLPSFGYDNLIANWAFLSFLQYFGDEPARLATDYRLSPEFFDIVVDRDPRFLLAYSFLSTSTAIYAAQPERSIALMDQGLQSLTPTLPDGSYLVWRNKAIDELLFLGDGRTARQSFLTAAEWAEASALPGSESAANASRQTAAFLATNPDSKSAQIAAWGIVLTSARDDRSRQTAIDRIRALGGEVSITPEGAIRVQLSKD